jgi:hypothetical protein
VHIATARRSRFGLFTAHREDVASVASPRLFLFADRRSLFGARGLPDFEWIDAGGSHLGIILYVIPQNSRMAFLFLNVGLGRTGIISCVALHV